MNENSFLDTCEHLFREFLGPMGETVFHDMKHGDGTPKHVHEYIDKLHAEDVLTEEDAERFHKEVKSAAQK